MYRLLVTYSWWFVVLLLAACDPARPSAAGTIEPAVGVDTASYNELVLRFAPTDTDCRDYTHNAECQIDQISIAIDQLQFPYQFQIGGGIGVSTVATWRLEAWLTNREDPGEAPTLGEPSVVEVVDFDSCENGCAEITGLSLVLQ